MLLELKIENFRSFSEAVTFSMMPRQGAKRIRATGSRYYPKAISVAGIFGANGAGKSNAVFALSYLQALVDDSGNYNTGDKIPHAPFKFARELANNPSSIEVLFSFKNQIWRYGFKVDEEKVHEEWLYARKFSTSIERLMFTRKNIGDGQNEEIKLSPSIRSYKKYLQDKTKKNQLFLSKLDQLDCEETNPPFLWIKYYLRVITSVSDFPKAVTADKCLQPEGRDQVVDLLQAVDVSVEDVVVKTSEYDVDSSDLDNVLAKLEHVKPSVFKLDANKLRSYELSFDHLCNDGSRVPLKFSDESLGTRNLFALVGPLLDTFQHGFTLVIDELNHSFHSAAFKHIIDLFYSVEANSNSAQLIFTSHDTAIMNDLERDQIWIAEKNKMGESDLYSFADFGPIEKGGARREAAFGRQYLHGRFGGLPEIDHIKSIKAVKKRGEIANRKEKELN